MTRKEEIVKEVKRREKEEGFTKIVRNTKGINSAYGIGFLEGTEWADNHPNLTWEDIRELYIIFAEVDVEIELCKTANIQAETIGYYQEVLKRFKAYKGE